MPLSKPICRRARACEERRKIGDIAPPLSVRPIMRYTLLYTGITTVSCCLCALSPSHLNVHPPHLNVRGIRRLDKAYDAIAKNRGSLSMATTRASRNGLALFSRGPHDDHKLLGGRE